MVVAFFFLATRLVKCVPGSSFQTFDRPANIGGCEFCRFVPFAFCEGFTCHFVARRLTMETFSCCWLLVFGIKLYFPLGLSWKSKTNHVWNIIFKCNLLGRGSPFNTEHKRPNDEQFQRTQYLDGNWRDVPGSVAIMLFSGYQRALSLICLFGCEGF